MAEAIRDNSEFAEFTVVPKLYGVPPTEAVTPQLKVINRNEENYPRLIGDFAGRRPQENTHILNEVFSRVRTADAAEVERKTLQMENDILIYREYVNQRAAIRAQIAERYAAADEDPNVKTMDDRIRARLATGKGITFISDFDGTISEDPNSYLLTHIPGSGRAEQKLAELGRDKFAYVVNTEWGPILEWPETHGVFFQGGQAVTLRPGVNETFGYLKDRQAEITVLSANFEPFVVGGLNQVPNAEDINVIAVTKDSILSTDKGTVITDLSQSNPEYATIFVGDGSSDIAAMEAADNVAVYFALEGSSFAKALEERGLAYTTYRNYHDIQRKIDDYTRPLAA